MTAEHAWGLILPFLSPLRHLITDDDISEICVICGREVYVERDGRMVLMADIRMEEQTLKIAVKNIARLLGDDITEEKPWLDARLPDGSRVAAMFPPCSVDGTTLTIRKFRQRHYTADELVRIGSMTERARAALRKAIEEQENILISGGTSTGKTTMLNALTEYIDRRDRILLIEDTAELQLDLPHVVRFEARRAQPKVPAVTIRELVTATMRHRPDRILLGEVRGGEAFDLLQALNTGHSGTLATIHANSARQAISRLSSCVLMAGVELPYLAIRSNIADSIQLLAHIRRTKEGKRELSEIVRINGFNQGTNEFALEQVYP